MSRVTLPEAADQGGGVPAVLLNRLPLAGFDGVEMAASTEPPMNLKTAVMW